jgi:hypothetical protein
MGILGAIVLALIVFVLRPMLAGRPVAGLGELTGPNEVGGGAARQIAGSDMRGELMDLPPHTLTKVDRLREVITSRGDDSAAVLRSWIEAPETHKEPAGT